MRVYMHRIHNVAFSLKMVSAVVQFTRYFLPITRCTDIAEKCPQYIYIYIQFTQWFLNVTETLMVVAIIQLTFRSMMMLPGPHSTQHTQQSVACPLIVHEIKQQIPHFSVTSRKLSEIQLGIQVYIQLECTAELWSPLYRSVG